MADAAVLDSSAILAFLFDEPGSDIVIPYLGDSTCSAVNLAEVATKLIERGHSPEGAAALLAGLPVTSNPFVADDALTVGILRPATRKVGLSLGDRCCLALGLRLDLPVVTTDRKWAEIANAVGVEVRVIR